MAEEGSAVRELRDSIKKKKNLFVMAGNYSSVLSVKGSVNDLAEGCNP